MQKAVLSKSNQNWAHGLCIRLTCQRKKASLPKHYYLYTRECLRIVVDSSINGVRVSKTLDILEELHGLRLPETIITDNGSELTSKAMSMSQ